MSESGFTPLHSAASAGKTSAAEVLLSAGADLMIEDRSGRLPFQTAFEYDRIETGLFLLEKTLEKNRCSLNFFRNGLCLPGRFIGKTMRHLTSRDKTGRYFEQKNTQK